MIYLVAFIGLILCGILYELCHIAHIMREIDSDILYVHSLLIEIRSK